MSVRFLFSCLTVIKFSLELMKGGENALQQCFLCLYVGQGSSLLSSRQFMIQCDIMTVYLSGRLHSLESALRNFEAV